jgi:hypothetical protein
MGGVRRAPWGLTQFRDIANGWKRSNGPFDMTV